MQPDQEFMQLDQNVMQLDQEFMQLDQKLMQPGLGVYAAIVRIPSQPSLSQGWAEILWILLIYIAVSTVCQPRLQRHQKRISKAAYTPRLRRYIVIIMSVSTACQSQLYVSLDYKGITKNFYSMIRISISTTCQPRLQRYF